MDPLLIVSPHLDDAVLSCGQLMAGRPECVVVTVFAGDPPNRRRLTTFDRDCGFRSAAHAMAGRRLEDEQALDLLDARPIHLGFVDHQYQDPIPLSDESIRDWMGDVEAIAELLITALDETGADVALGPLGILHPDHETTAAAFAMLLDARPAVDGWLYEELPGRVLWPDLSVARLDRWHDAGWESGLDFCGTGPLEVKEDAITLYGSQAYALRAACGGNLHPLFVPERRHRIWREAE